MTITLNSPNRLKICLNSNEANALNLRNTHSYSVKQALLPLLAQAQLETGFYPQRAKLIVDILPEENGGCVLLFTAVYGVQITPGKSSIEPEVYAFSSSVGLCAALLGLYKHYAHRIYKSALYFWHGEYRLIIKALDYLDQQSTRFIADFANLVGTDEILAAYICEHGKEIMAENAVEHIGCTLNKFEAN